MVQFPDPAQSPFKRDGDSLGEGKFADPVRTGDGSRRAFVPLSGLDTLWFNTGTLCNLACATCYIESSPTNDALVYITKAEVEAYLDEIEREEIGTRQIGFTGGEPFMNRDMVPIMEMCLERGFEVLVLSNAMRPMRRFEEQLKAIADRHSGKLLMRVSLDHHTKEAHEAERGQDTWDKAIDGLLWLHDNGFRVAVAGRQLPTETMEEARDGYDRLLKAIGIVLDLSDPERLVVFPEMDESLDTPEITEECWGILSMQKTAVMCSTSRMVVKRKGEATPRVAACTLLPYDPQFDMGETLTEASQAVKLNHPHCSRFCVLGGASCSA
ncbi:radical SAM protein [Parvularcula sp. ZS-1/3]|uniref:Radical SAM protein n=1 Tax=Parvularcula mediterranea TaxID=2732508 RepID=A0A7Y3W3S4_9PROT|nr:radical SAM protein [Parvularcula mediterranea]NNU14754.1 radical SAM protein [Parvularcula mediterranea]